MELYYFYTSEFKKGLDFGKKIKKHSRLKEFFLLWLDRLIRWL